MMDFDEVNQKLTEALDEVLENDQYLLTHGIHEPAISHRLAVYLEPKFPDFNIDCEYNGNVEADSGKKYVYLLRQVAEQLGKLKEEEDEQEILTRYVFPDIIVHMRGRNGSENNLLIIEVKKSSNLDDGAWDAEKLSRFTSSKYENRFNYQYGAFVRFAVGEKPDYSIQWYQNGERFL
jgi:hypothetical protein